jgi:hypothetical protein
MELAHHGWTTVPRAGAAQFWPCTMIKARLLGNILTWLSIYQQQAGIHYTPASFTGADTDCGLLAYFPRAAMPVLERP